MLNYPNKVDNTRTNSSLVFANELNSIFNEQKNIVSKFYELNKDNNEQMFSAIDLLSGIRFYNDYGDVNDVILKRENLANPKDSDTVGVVGYFIPKENNTGKTMMSFLGTEKKPLLLNNEELQPYTLGIGNTYGFICKGDYFELFLINEKITKNEDLRTNKIITTDRIEIKDNKLTLPFKSCGDIILNKILCFDTKDSDVVYEYSCKIDTNDYLTVLLDNTDDLNGKYGTVSYLILEDLEDTVLVDSLPYSL